MIAMALVCRPSLLIADEPTTALDVTIQAQILALIKELQAELEMAVLIITHDLGVVANVAEHVVVLYAGRVMEQGPVQALFERPEHPYLRALLRAVPHFDMKPGERLVSVRTVDHQTGPLVEAQEPWPADAGPMHLDVRNVVKTFRAAADRLPRAPRRSRVPRRRRCQPLDPARPVLRPRRRKRMRQDDAVEGHHARARGRRRRGASTTTAARRSTSARADGEELMRFRRRVQYIFQDPFGSLSPRMTVFDILREPLIIHGIGDADYRAEMAKELMRLVGLDPRFLNRYPHSFSGGQRQRIGIARALALKPDLILCDEPVSALDVSIQAQVLNLLKDLQAELGLTYLFISHNLAVVDYIADEIAVMCRGRIVEIAPREVLFHNPMHPYTLGLARRSAVSGPRSQARPRRGARRRRTQAGGMARAVRVDADRAPASSSMSATGIASACRPPPTARESHERMIALRHGIALLLAAARCSRGPARRTPRSRRVSSQPMSPPASFRRSRSGCRASRSCSRHRAATGRSAATAARCGR